MVEFFQAIEYIEKQLIDVPLDENQFDGFHLGSIAPPIISYPSIEWKKDKCTQLGIPFEMSNEEHSSLKWTKTR